MGRLWHSAENQMMKSYLLAVQFFTRIPIPLAIDQVEERLKRSVSVFPLVGLLLGVIYGGVYYMGSLLFSPIMAWFFILILDVCLTGGFHQDALADTADGLFSSRDRQRMLEIMKDSRVGSNGVLALIFYYGGLLLPLISVAGSLGSQDWLRLAVCLPVVGKLGISLLFYKMVYAGKEQGLGTYFLNIPTYRIFISLLLSAGLIFVLLGSQGLISLLLVIVGQLFYRFFVLKKVGGFNGDTLGAFHCLAQLLFLWVYLI